MVGARIPTTCCGSGSTSLIGDSSFQQAPGENPRKSFIVRALASAAERSGSPFRRAFVSLSRSTFCFHSPADLSLQAPAVTLLLSVL